MSQITIDLPFPVSINAVWRSGKGRVFKSKRYRSWIKEAWGLWLAQRSTSELKHIKGPYTLKIILNAPDRRRRDIGNYEKGLSDFLQMARIIENDNLCQKQDVVWGSATDAPNGARLILTALQS